MPDYVFATEPQVVGTVWTKHRRITTKIPAPGTAELLERLRRVESRSMQGQLPIVWKSAKDFYVIDIAGNQWIDFTSTIFVANVGHSNKRVCAALKAQLADPLISCYAYANEQRVLYLEKLIEFAGKPFEKAFLLSAGTEATEAAFKLMRMHGHATGKRRLGIITIENNWHGRTLGAQMLSSNAQQKEWIGQLDQDIHHIPFPYPWRKEDPEVILSRSIEELRRSGISLETDICGFMLETFQGWGAIFYPREYVQAIRRLCDENGILMCFDEMQAGFGRTGESFGFKHYGVSPDLIACGKGMGGGISLSGVIGTKQVMDLPEVGNMSSTHSANPLVCAAGLAVLEELRERNLVREAKRKGVILLNKLDHIRAESPEWISWILGEGLIAAVHFSDPEKKGRAHSFASRVCELCMQRGLLVVHTGRESIKIGPPLSITDDALLEGLSVLREAIHDVRKTY